MVRSYSAMAISSRASATLRLPFLAPQSKMGRLIEGPKLQLSPSFPIKFPRSVEAKPILPVSEMDGKKAARAAPILARAARSFSSAANMSGRVRSEERRVGKECVRTCSSRWSPYHQNKNNRHSKMLEKQTNTHKHIYQVNQ